MRTALLFLIAAVALPAAAQHADITPWMTGERLVKLLGNVDPATVDWTSTSPFRTRAIAAEYRDLANGEFVHGYIQAVHWSESYRPHPDELEADARQALQRMSAAQLKRNAAILIVEVWRKKWPCPAIKRRDK
jgi:hypothetical protein